MRQGYVPPDQKEGRKLQNRTSGKVLRIVYIVVIVIGLIGFIAETNIVVRLLLLLVAAFAAFRLYVASSKKKVNTHPAESLESAHKAPEVAPPVQQVPSSKVPQATLPKLPKQIGGIPNAYQFQEVDIAMTDKVVNDFLVFRPGDAISFIPEPTNAYDPQAIQLWSNNQLLGYVYRGKIQDMLNDFLKFGEPVHGMIFSVRTEEKKITYSVGFYRPARPKSYGKMLGSGRLTANSGEEAQDNIAACDEGDEVTVSYDYDKERFEVSYIDYIGCLPKKLEQYADTATFVIDEIGENDNEKQYVVVGAYAAKG